MSVNTFLKTAVRLQPCVSILLRGNHGIGKSQLGRQLARAIAAKEGLKDFPVIDRRLSQVTEGDIVGLPSTDNQVTRFNPPDWYMQACRQPVFLFLDELNRATPEVMQAAFQIVLDRELNGWKLHTQTRVMSAINVSSQYNVNEVDPALLNRFWAVDLVPEVEDWVSWGNEKCENPDPEVQKVKALFGGTNCMPVIVDFIVENSKWLDPPKSYEPGTIHPTRRSWERLGDALAVAGVGDNFNDDGFYPICVGFIGNEATIAFREFVANSNNRFTGEDILNNYPKVRKRVISKKRNELLNVAIEKLAEVVLKLDKITPAQGECIEKFALDLTPELRISLWIKLTSTGVDKLELAKSLQAYLAKHVVAAFGVPYGEAGVGVLPNIPGMFANKTETPKK